MAEEEPRRQGYRPIDEVESSPDQEAPPWSIQHLYLFTIFAGSLVGGVMAVLNCTRLRIPEERSRTLLVALGSTLLEALGWVVHRWTIDPQFVYLIEVAASLVRFVAGHYYRNTQIDAFVRYLDQGGKPAGIRIPLTVCTLYHLVMYLIGYFSRGH